MKKFLFSLSMVAALSLAVFTTSCGGDDDNGNILPQLPGTPTDPDAPTDPDTPVDPDTPENQTAEYTSSLNVVTGYPDEIEAGFGEDLGTITEDVKIVINSSSNTIDLSIKGINLGELANIPSGLQAPFDIELQNVPYTETEGEYNVSYNPAINEEEMTTDVAININGNNAYLFSLEGSINANSLELKIFVLGDENLVDIPVNIFVNGTKK